MNLKETAEKYKSLSCYTIEIYSNRPGCMTLTFELENLHHLLGIQHLVDREYIANFPKKKDFPNRLIMDENLRQNIVNSKYFNTHPTPETISVSERISLFNLLPWALLNEQCHCVKQKLGLVPADYLLYIKHDNRYLVLHLIYNKKENSLSPLSISHKSSLNNDYTLHSFPVKIILKK